MALKIVEEKSGETGRAFHTNILVGKEYGSYVNTHPTGVYRDQIVAAQGPELAAMVVELMCTEKVQHIIIHPYSVEVYVTPSRTRKERWDTKLTDIVTRAFKRLAGEVLPPPLVEIQSIGSHIRKFITDFEISKLWSETFLRPVDDRNDLRLQELGVQGGILMGTVLEIPGVLRVRIQPYSLVVEIGKAFAWDDISDGSSLGGRIESAFRLNFGSNIDFVPLKSS